MALGVNSVLSMGVGALFASQANIQTTGNNISNVNTPGYSRQAVVLQEKYAVNYYPGQVGQGVQATEIIRYFDSFIEKNYLQKLGTAARYQAQYTQLRYVENLFNEANVDGMHSSMNSFFTSWNKLAQQPDSLPTRQALLSTAETFTASIRSTDNTLRQLEEQINTMVQQEVNSANQLMQEIAALNKEISANYLAGRNNPNELMDKRDTKVRELGAIIDVDVHDRGPGDYVVNMKNGTTLVQNEVAFSLRFSGDGVENNLTATSPYKEKNVNGTQKTVQFSGSDHYEYTVDIVNGGDIGSGATFRVSIDGGRTWLKNDDGSDRIFNANEEGTSVSVGELNIWFDAGTVASGDRFVISPKSDVYWVSPTAGPINISPQIYGDGTDNSSRITGGTLGGLLEFRDYKLGEYRDRLNALAKETAWQVNRLHSQGAGLEPMKHALGTYVVGNTTVALGSPEARFTWSDKLQSGDMSFSIYDSEGNPVFPYPGFKVSEALGGNFDPSVHSLEDIRSAINSHPELSQYFTANIVNGKFEIAAKDGYSFSITDDTTGLAAALGINTFFTGDDAQTFALNGVLSSNLNLINAGRLNINGEINPGDNQTASEIASLVSKKVEVGTYWTKDTDQSLTAYFATLVTKIGADTQGVQFTAATETAIAQDLYDRQEEISGVNLDEEMSNLIKFQASYKAAAKLITTADEMLQTLLSLKQ